jgi:RNA polymerase sigma factor (sigma-70 family)
VALMPSRWLLTPDAFEKLLGVLSEDRNLAGQRYETIRAGLVRFFEWRGCGGAESLADETIDRVCRRLDGGEPIDGSGAYFHGVARNVLKEHQRSEHRHERLGRVIPPPQGSAWEHPLLAGSERERLACLDHCLQTLSREERELIRQYYGSEASDKVADHARLAQRLGISPGTLRVRAYRLRRALEACVTRCLETKGGRRLRLLRSKARD